MSKLKLNNFLPYRINLSAEIIRKSISVIYGNFGFDKAQWRIVVYLGDCKGFTTVKTIREGVYLEKVAFSRALTQLEKKGLVIRQTDKNDRRNHNIKLTEKGIETHNKLISEVSKWNNQFKNMSQKDIDKIFELLKQVDDIITKN